MGRTDIVYGVLAAALSTVFFFSTLGFPVREGAVNPRAYPWFVIIGMFALSVSLVVKGVVRLAADRTARRLQTAADRKTEVLSGEASESASAAGGVPRTDAPDRTGAAGGVPAGTVRTGAAALRSPIARFAALAGAGVLYVLVIEIAGYLASTPLLIAFSVFTFGERRPVRIALVSIVTTAVLYYLFRMVFRVPLPRWGL